MAQVQAPAGGDPDPGSGAPPPNEGDWSRQVGDHGNDFWIATLNIFRATGALDSIR